MASVLPSLSFSIWPPSARLNAQIVKVADWSAEERTGQHALVPLETKGVASRTLNGNFTIASPGQISLHELQQLLSHVMV
jgi:hypothetical protein